MADNKEKPATPAQAEKPAPEAAPVLAAPGSLLLPVQAEPNRTVTVETADGTIITTFM